MAYTELENLADTIRKVCEQAYWFNHILKPLIIYGDVTVKLSDMFFGITVAKECANCKFFGKNGCVLPGEKNEGAKYCLCYEVKK